MALVMPIFLTLSFGFINFALISFGMCNVTFATHTAMRYATLHSANSYNPATSTAITNLVRPYIFQYPSNTQSTTVSYSSGGNVVGQTVTVTSTIIYTIRLPGYTYTPLNLKVVESGIIIM